MPLLSPNTALRVQISLPKKPLQPVNAYLLKQHPEKDSVAMKRRACGWNEEYMLQVLTGTKS
jgi:hypothetical protein